MVRILLAGWLLSFSFWVNSLNAQEVVQWMSFEEALEAQQKEKRKMIIDVYTDWCAWCKKMDQSTFSNEFIIEYVNQHFYPVKFNAEQKEDILFKEKTYKYVKYGRNGYHELAVALTQGRLNYPTIVFMDEDLSIIQALRGFQSSLRFEQIMTYFAQDYHKSIPWNKYSENYQPVISKN